MVCIFIVYLNNYNLLIFSGKGGFLQVHIENRIYVILLEVRTNISLTAPGERLTNIKRFIPNIRIPVIDLQCPRLPLFLAQDC